MKELDNIRKLLDDLVAEFDKVAPNKSKPKLTTWGGGCAEVVKPKTYLDSMGNMNTLYDTTHFDPNHTPSERHAKSVLALCQLMTIAEALNGEYEADGGRWFVEYFIDGNKLVIDNYDSLNTNPVLFTSEQSTQHSIDHFSHLWMDFFMVEVDS